MGSSESTAAPELLTCSKQVVSRSLWESGLREARLRNMHDTLEAYHVLVFTLEHRPLKFENEFAWSGAALLFGGGSHEIDLLSSREIA